MRYLLGALIGMSGISAMDKVVSERDRLERKGVKVAFSLTWHEVVLNGNDIPIQDAYSLFKTLDSIIALFKTRCHLLKARWYDRPATPTSEWYKNLDDACVHAMKQLQNLLNQLQESPVCRWHFGKNAFQDYNFFSEVLECYEQLHSLRIVLCTSWNQQYKVTFIPSNFVGRKEEALFKEAASSLSIDITVETWFNRMRRHAEK